MIRERLSKTRPIAEENFRWRGGEITRLEGFSDAVFAFALTLLVVSLEVPRTFDELIRAMKAFPAFGVCFAILAVVWHDHCRFFRRYGLQNSWMTFLNFVLLFVVLFYIYPLKFLFFTTFDGAAVPAEQGRTLLLIYGLGYAAIFLTFLLMYVHAWKRREDLALNAIELMKNASEHHRPFGNDVGGSVIGSNGTAPATAAGRTGWLVLFRDPGLLHDFRNDLWQAGGANETGNAGRWRGVNQPYRALRTPRESR